MGKRGSIVLFLHNACREMTATQLAVQHEVGFRVHENTVSEVELQMEDWVDGGTPEDQWDARRKVLAIERMTGLCPLSFASADLNFEGKSIFLSADSELIATLPKVKIDVTFAGAPIDKVERSVSDLVLLNSDMVPLVFADFSRAEIDRQDRRGKADDEVQWALSRFSVAC